MHRVTRKKEFLLKRKYKTVRGYIKYPKVSNLWIGENVFVYDKLVKSLYYLKDSEGYIEWSIGGMEGSLICRGRCAIMVLIRTKTYNIIIVSRVKTRVGSWGIHMRKCVTYPI